MSRSCCSAKVAVCAGGRPEQIVTAGAGSVEKQQPCCLEVLEVWQLFKERPVAG